MIKRKNSMKTSEDIERRIILGGNCMLPPGMGKIDVLVPILNLVDREEEFMLDLHYSIWQTRTWKFDEAASLASKIIKKIENRREFVELEAKDRLPNVDNMVSDWILGLEMIQGYPARDNIIQWFRD